MAGWQGLLAPDEKILWQDRPQATFDWTMMLNRQAAKGLFTVAFSAIWIAITLQVTADSEAPLLMRLLFPLIALPILLGGLRQTVGPALARYDRLRKTTYSLSTEAAYIATESRGKRQLERLSLRDGTLSPTLEEGTPGSVWLITRPRPSGSWNLLSAQSPNETMGFEQIPEARKVYRMVIDQMAALQPEGRRPPPPPSAAQTGFDPEPPTDPASPPL